MGDKEKEEKHPIFDKQRIAYGFLSCASATYTEEALGERLAQIFMAVDDYEEYIDKLPED